MEKTLLSVGLLSAGAIIGGNSATAAPIKVAPKTQNPVATAPPIDQAVAFQVEKIMAKGTKKVSEIAYNTTLNNRPSPRPANTTTASNPSGSAELLKNVRVAQNISVPQDDEIRELQRRLNELPNRKFQVTQPGGNRSISPGMSIANPVGFGADNNTVYLSASYQNRTRFTQTSDGELGIGFGLGNARNGGIGAEISYTINSFGTSRNFGEGGFNIKLHSQIANNTAVALGWNRFLNLENRGRTDYPGNSYYGAITHIIKTQEDIDQLFSRIALTGGVGGGQFLSERALQDDYISKGGDISSPSGLNVFGSMAVRIAKPISAIVEYTGQDVSAGLSIVPFEGLPLVLTPAVRDISGAGDGARFVMGAGLSFQL